MRSLKGILIACRPQNRCHAAVYVFIRVAHEETLMRIAVRPCHSVGPHQQVPSCCTRSITVFVRAASPKETRTWFSTTSFRISHPPRCNSAAKRAARATGPLNQVA